MTYSENYYTSPDFLGRKDFINKDWGNGGPGGVTNSNYFSAKFIKHQWFDGGFYKFYTQFDDGMKLVIDGRLIIDKWENPAWDFEARADISAGWHTVEVYYQEKTGGAKISLSWELACKDYANTTSWCGEFYPNNYYGGIPFKPVQRLGDFWDDNWGNGNVTFELNNQRNLFSGSYVNQLNQLPTDNFTGYFTKLHYFPAATYTFITQADDNIQIFIDGENIISQLSCCNQTRVDKQLTAGNHLIQIRYKEFTGEAKLVFRWEYKDRNFPTGQIYSPSFNYQTISGSQFKVEATANDNVGTNNTGVAFVSFYAYYNNQLYFLGLENNDNIDNKYSALINLSNITSSQNIEFSIAVTDRAGNVTNVAGGSRWAYYQKPSIDITIPFNVTSPATVPNCSQGSQCSSNFVMLYGNKNTYDNNRTVWVVTHGRGDNTDGWVKDIGNQIHNSYPNDVVLLLDWRNGASDTSNPPYNSGKFAGPIAKAAKQRLNDWGFSNQDKLNIIGHSLGSLLSAKLSEEMGRAKTLTLLSPPGNLGIGYYDVNPNEKLSSFQGKAQFSRAIVMSGEGADDQTLAKTADEKILVDSPGISGVTPGAKHVANTRLYLQLIGGRKLYNNYLDLNNLSSNNFPLSDNYNARLVTSGNIDTNYLQVNYIDKLVNYGSTGGENIPTISYGVLEDFGNSGDDLFQFSSVERNQLNTIKDFSGNDKIQLSNYYAGAPYYIQSENSYPVIYQSNKGINYRVGRVEGSKSSNFLTNPNALKESEGLIIYR
jgi:pimeloyl-ACP methyl ester carboxylesterase